MEEFWGKLRLFSILNTQLPSGKENPIVIKSTQTESVPPTWRYWGTWLMLFNFQRISPLPSRESSMVRHSISSAFDCTFFWPGFYMFVRPHHQEHFREMCEGLTGTVCGEGEKQLQQRVQAEGSAPSSKSWCPKAGTSCGQGWEWTLAWSLECYFLLWWVEPLAVA